MAEDRKLGRDAMMSIRGDTDRMMDIAGQQRWPPGAVALFSCGGRGFFEEVVLPRGVRDWVVVDEMPRVRPMLAMLGEYHHLLRVADSEEKNDMIETTFGGGWAIEAALRPHNSRCSPDGTGAQLRCRSNTWELR